MPISVARPYDEEELKKEMARVQARYQSPPMQQPEKGLMQTVGESIGSNVVGKVGTEGANMAMNKLGSMFAPKVAAGANLAGTASNVANAATIANTTAAGAAGASGMAALAPMLGPLGVGLFAAKMFGLFNDGGFVGPLGNMSKVKYKEAGGDITHEYEISMGPLSKGV